MSAEPAYCLVHAEGFGLLALTPAQLSAAVSRAIELMPGPVQRSPGLAADGSHGRSSEAQLEPLLTAEELGNLTGMAASWWATAASHGSVPSYKLGRWVRFRLSEVLASGATHKGQRIIARESHKQPELPVAKRLRTNK
jgi:predicted DNA-binding transcriptional regulator AlpA